MRSNQHFTNYVQSIQSFAKLCIDENEIDELIERLDASKYLKSFIDLPFDAAHDKDCRNLLQIAAAKGLTKLIHFLISKEANLDYNSDGYTALFYAVRNGQLESVRELIAAGANIKIKSGNKFPLTITATMNNRSKILALLLESGLDPDAADHNGDSPLHHAAFENCIECADILIQAGADIDHASEDGSRAVHYAAAQGHAEFLSFLISETNVEIDVPRHNGSTAMSMAAIKGHSKCIEVLADAGVKIDDSNTNKPLLFTMLAADNAECMRALHKAGANVNVVVDEMSLIFNAILLNRTECLKVLIECGANVEVKNVNNETVCHVAVYMKSVDLLKMVIDAGAPVNSKDTKGVTPFLLAALSDSVDCLNFLIAHGVDIQQTDYYGNNSLILAAKAGNLACIKILSQYIPIDAANELGETALYWSAQCGNTECVEALIALGADVNHRNEDGSFALYTAARNGHEKCMALLLNAGANSQQANDYGETAYSAAKRISSETCVLFDSQPAPPAMTLHAWDKNLNSEFIKKTADLPGQSAYLRYANCFGYGFIDNGFCLGISLSFSTSFWISVLTAEEGIFTFYKRLFKLYSLSTTPDTEVNSATIIEFLSFFDRVKLLQDSQSFCQYHHDLLPALLVNASSIEKQYFLEDLVQPLVFNLPDNRSIKRENVYNNAGVFTLNELQDLLDCLVKYLGSLPIELNLFSNRHVITLCYCPTTKDWLLFDANRMKIRAYNSADKSRQWRLVNKIMLALDCHKSQLILQYNLTSINLFKTDLTAQLQLLEKDNIWINIHKLKKYKLTATDNKGDNLLLSSCRLSMCIDITTLINAYKDIISIHDSIEQLITKSGIQGNIPVLKSILAAGYQLNDYHQALRAAATYGQTDYLKFCIESGVNVNLSNETQNTALHAAVANGFAECADLLLQAGAHTDSTNNTKHTPLFLAVAGKSVICMQLLIKGNVNGLSADVNYCDINGKTPLHIAAAIGFMAGVRLLLAANAKVDAQDNEHSTPLHLAATHGHIDVIRELIRYKANINLEDELGNTALITTIMNDHDECSLLLLSEGANTKKTSTGVSAVECALLKSNTTILSALINAGVDINEQMKERTALFTAALLNDLEFVQLLIRAKADVNLGTDKQATPLFIAAQHGHDDVVEELLDCKEIELDKCFITTAESLHSFIETKRLFAKRNMQTFITAQSDPENILMTPRDIATIMGHKRIVTMLDEAAHRKKQTHPPVANHVASFFSNRNTLIKIGIGSLLLTAGIAAATTLYKK